MDRKSKEKLRLDRRLIRRRGWIPPEQLEQELASLPDVAHKGSRGDEPAQSPPPPADPTPPNPSQAP